MTLDIVTIGVLVQKEKAGTFECCTRSISRELRGVEAVVCKRYKALNYHLAHGADDRGVHWCLSLSRPAPLRSTLETRPRLKQE